MTRLVRDIRDEAIEECAMAAEAEISQSSHSDLQDQWNAACREIAERIRALKSAEGKRQ